jgi:hypothetical protein
LYLKSTIGIEVEYLLQFSRRKIPRVYPSNMNDVTIIITERHHKDE